MFKGTLGVSWAVVKIKISLDKVWNYVVTCKECIHFTTTNKQNVAKVLIMNILECIDNTLHIAR